MRGLFLSGCSSKEIYDQWPEDGGAAGDGAKLLSQPTCFFNGQKKKCTKKGKPKDLPVDREIDETPGVWLDTKTHPRRSS
jgi:hypothetical protein